MRMSPPQYMDVRTDFGFKKLFGQEESKPVLKGFLYNLLELPAPIAELTFLGTEQLPRTPEERRSIFDIYCIDENDSRFIVEMQNTQQLHFRDRTLYYSTFPISHQASQGEDWNYELNAVYCLGILNFRFEDDDQCIHRVRFIDETTHKVFGSYASY